MIATLEQLLGHEEALVGAQCAVLKARQENAYPEFSDQEKAETPYFEVKLQGVSEADGKLPGSNGLIPMQWKGVLVTRPVTQRFKNSDKQATMLRAIRIERCLFPVNLNRYLQFHQVTYMREITTVPTHIAQGQFDVTEVQHELVWEIKPALAKEFTASLAG
jgi:hypothetical protein